MADTVIVDEVVASVSLMDSSAMLDQRTLGKIVSAVMAAMDDRSARDQRRSEETHIADDGRRGISLARG